MALLKRGDEVAVLPHLLASPSEVLRIAIVAHVGPVLIELADGRLYFANDGLSFDDPQHDYIVPVTEEHRSALSAKA